MGVGSRPNGLIHLPIYLYIIGQGLTKIFFTPHHRQYFFNIKRAKARDHVINAYTLIWTVWLVAGASKNGEIFKAIKNLLPEHSVSLSLALIQILQKTQAIRLFNWHDQGAQQWSQFPLWHVYCGLTQLGERHEMETGDTIETIIVQRFPLWRATMRFARMHNAHCTRHTAIQYSENLLDNMLARKTFFQQHSLFIERKNCW